MIASVNLPALKSFTSNYMSSSVAGLERRGLKGVCEEWESIGQLDVLESFGRG